MHPHTTESTTSVAPTRRTPPSSHVLVVDDERGVRDVAARALARHGFHVTTLPDPTDALSLLDRSPGEVAVVVSDLHMPGMNGVELAERIRDRHPTTAVILMSGLVTPRLQSRALRAGIHHVLAKPFRLRDLTRAVDATGPTPTATSGFTPE